ncbi:MAG: MYG1 family protein [Akkermansiaceae bacterium]|nr:MYG1 family protein [Akkermansiaceae bacterium]
MAYTTIITHPGGAHKDDFLACCLLLARHAAPVERRNPEDSELEDPSIAVVDIGHQHDASKGNFDHHQFPRDHPPTCSLSLVLQHMELYEDAKAFCDWLEPAEWLDTRGPNETAKWLDISRDALAKLNSPIDVTLLRRFAAASSHQPGEPLWEIMRWIGEDLIEYLTQLRERLDFIDQHHERWSIEGPDGSFEVIFLPRTEPLPDDPSAGLGRFVMQAEPGIAGMIYPDSRGEGYGLKRYEDHPRLDFTRIESCEDVHFAHARGFIAKTSATSPERLRELMAKAWE